MNLFHDSSLVMSRQKSCNTFKPNKAYCKYDYFLTEPIDWDSFLPTVDRCLLEHLKTWRPSSSYFSSLPTRSKAISVIWSRYVFHSRYCLDLVLGKVSRLVGLKHAMFWLLVSSYSDYWAEMHFFKKNKQTIISKGIYLPIPFNVNEICQAPWLDSFAPIEH